MSLRNILILLVLLGIATGAYYQYGRPAPPPPPQARDYVWLINMDDITAIKLSLPHEHLSQKFVKIVNGDSFPWFFDDAQHSPVDSVRWSSGVPLLLSGPGADRKVVANATPQQLASFGLTDPQMVIELTIKNRKLPMIINVGNSTLDGSRTYVQAPDTTTVAAVDGSWASLLSGLVKDPPHPVPTPTPTPIP